MSQQASCVQLYFVGKKDEINPLEKQMEKDYDYMSIKWTVPIGFVPKIEKYQILANIDWEKKEIIAIAEELPASDFISDTKRDIILKNNSSFLNTNRRKDKIQQVPKPEDLYLLPIKWDIAISALDMGKYPLFIGPKGSGKTSFAQALAAATGRAYFPINCGAIFKPKQTLVGTIQAKEGSTYVVDSEFMKHFSSNEPTLIFLDEISRIPNGAANYMMTILDRIQSYIYVEEKGERIHKGKNVVFCAAANFGFEYTDTRNIDGALLDRFIKIMIDYLEEQQEVELVTGRAKKANIGDIKKLVKHANHCREAKDKLRVGVSTRQLIDMAHFLEKGFAYSEVIDEIFLNLFYNGTMDERDTVRQMLESSM